jgi:hypothetical protein
MGDGPKLTALGCAVGQKHQLAVSPVVQAKVERLWPIFESKGSGDRYREPTFGTELRVLREHVVTMHHALFPPRGADAKAAFIEIAEAHHAVRIAVHDFDQIGQHALHACGVQGKIGRSPRELADPLDHAVAVRRHLRAEIAQTRGERLGETVLGDILTSAVRAAPPELGPWDTLFRVFQAPERLFVENRPFSKPRHRLIESSPALQERALAKTRLLIAGMVSALRERDVPDHLAMLVAQMGMAALGHAVACWFDDDSSDLNDHLVQAFQKVRDLSASGAATPKGKASPKG